MPRLALRRAEDAPQASNVGFTLPGIEMKSDNDQRLIFRSPYRAIAYIDDSGFHEFTDDEWTPSGDLGEQLPNGSWCLLGRSNDVFKRHGEKISLPQILTTVNRSWNGDSAIYLERDPGGEEGFVLVLSPEPDEAQLREILLGFRKNHRRPHWPLRIESTEVLPSLANGKTDLLGLSELKNKILHWRQRI